MKRCNRNVWGSEAPEHADKTETSDGEFLVKEPAILEVCDNRIFFYADIDRSEVMKLNKELRRLDTQHIADQQNEGHEKLTPIYLHVQSYGGSVFAGFSAMDNILACRCPVTTIVDGIAASAATFLTIVGKQRLISQHSWMLIHQISSGMWGKFSEFQDEMKNLERLMALIRGIMLERTRIPAGKLDEIMKHDLYLDAKTCLRYGMVDKIV